MTSELTQPPRTGLDRNRDRRLSRREPGAKCEQSVEVACSLQARPHVPTRVEFVAAIDPDGSDSL